jgi:hypothetical protein
MTTFLWFLLGQIAGVFAQVALWVDDEAGCGWGDYLKKRSHQGRHVFDLIFSAAFFIAWQQNMLVWLASLFGDSAKEKVALMPEAPLGIGAAVIALLLCLLSRKITGKLFPDTDAHLTPKGD